MSEISQAEYESIELRALEARRRFLEELGKHPELRRLYRDSHELERVAMDARRERREHEWREAGAPDVVG